MRALVLTAGALAGACSSVHFEVDEPLSSRPLEVSGDLGLSAVSCDPDADPVADAPPGLASGEPAAVAVGPLTARFSAPHRDTTSRRLLGEAVREDFAELLAAAEALRDGEALRGRGVPAAAGDVALGAARGWLDEAVELLEDIHELISLPLSATETLALTFRANVEGRAVLGTCVTTHRARIYDVTRGPRFRLTCRLLTSASGEAYTLEARGRGSSVNHRFEGYLDADAGGRLRFGSQSATILGVGAVHGFDLRRPGRGDSRRGGEDGPQVAAVSFYHERTSEGEAAAPRAWALPLASRGRSDAALAVLALAYAFPWPSDCDSDRLREDAGEDAA